MQVKELIEELKTYPEDFEVYTAVDAEGNYFKQFGGFCGGYVEEENGKLPYCADHIYALDEYEDDDPDRPEAENVLIIWPA